MDIENNEWIDESNIIKYLPYMRREFKRRVKEMYKND